MFNVICLAISELFYQHFFRDEASIVLALGRRRKRRKGTSCCKFLIHSMSILSYLRTDLAEAVVDVDVMVRWQRAQ